MFLFINIIYTHPSLFPWLGPQTTKKSENLLKNDRPRKKILRFFEYFSCLCSNICDGNCCFCHWTPWTLRIELLEHYTLNSLNITQYDSRTSSNCRIILMLLPIKRCEWPIYILLKTSTTATDNCSYYSHSDIVWYRQAPSSFVSSLRS
jgi:hypothetical protein